MPEPAGLIEHLKEKQPATWALLKRAALDGLVVIDEETDAVTAPIGQRSVGARVTWLRERGSRVLDVLT